jgi:hypothetical protein
LPTRYVLQTVDPNARSKRRRLEAQQQRRRRRLIVAGLLLALISAAVLGGVIAIKVRGHKTVRAAARAEKPAASRPGALQPRPLPNEVRGVHITPALAGIPGKLQQYLALKKDGLNTIELDVKDENGEIGFPVDVPLARRVGSALRYYNPQRTVAATARGRSASRSPPT